MHGVSVGGVGSGGGDVYYKQAESDISRRVGRFFIADSMISRDFQSVLAALDGCVVLRCEHHFAKCLLEYDAIHPQFEPVPDGHQIPLYRAIISGGKRHWEPDQ